MMSTTGRAFVVGTFDVIISHGSPSESVQPAIAFEQSRTLPPPTASITSILFSLQSLIPSRTLEYLGLGSIPESSVTSNLSAIY